MAADQRKRRLSSNTAAFGYGFQEQYNKAKKRDLRSPKYDFNCNTHVSLKWDDNGKKVVAKEDQIGISWRHLAPFNPSAPCSNAKLADVVTVPKDVFELNDLADVLSYEVWQSVLTEKERNFLVQFLPPGPGADGVVQALFTGDNFCFGNPFLKWGSSLCSGDLHPDTILQHEKSFKTNKKAYYSEIQQYHDNMIRNLQNLKQRCASSKDPEAEIQQIMSRSRRHEKIILSDANGHKCHKPGENVAAMSESLSSMADEKLYYSDNQKLSVIRDAEIQKRIRNQDLKDKHEKSMVPPNGSKVSSKPKKAEKMQKPNITPNDGAKYMSYVKISKKQHELVKSMKQSGSSIQSKALTRLLGGLDSSNVKPYEMFVEEEQKRIHQYWLNLGNKDLPTALQNWRKKQLEKQQIMDSLCQEIREKMGVQSKDDNLVNPYDEDPTHDEDGEAFHETSDDHQDDDSAASKDSMSDNDKEDPDPCSLKNDSPLQNLPLNVNEKFNPSSSMDTEPLQNRPVNVNEDFDPSSTVETKSLRNISLNIDGQFHRSASMEAKLLQNPPLNGKDQFDQSASVENQPLQHPPLNIKEELDPSASIGNQSLQHPPLNVNDPSCMENPNKIFDPSSNSIENKSSLGNRSLNENEDFTPMDLNAEDNPVTSETSGRCSIPNQRIALTSVASHTMSHRGTHNSATASNAAGVMSLSGSSLKNMWSSIGFPESYHAHPTTLHAGSGGLRLRHPQVVPEQPTHLIDLESDIPEEDTTKDLLNRHTSHMPFFNPYPNRDRNELLHSLIKRDNFHQEPVKQPSSEFHPTNVIMGSAFPSHFREPLQPPFGLDHHRHKAQSELYMHQNIQDRIYSDNNRYSVQGPQNFPTLNARDWSNSRISNPSLPPQLGSGEMLNQSWYGNESRAHGGWSTTTSDATVFPAPNLGSGSSNDQSLYSVLSQCNLRPRVPYSTVGSTEQMISPTNYGQEIAVGIPMTSSGLAQTGSPFDYLSGGEASSTTLKNPNMGWMGLGHQPSSLHDPSGKPFLKSWNQ
ncbi:hypothetical protein SOVF_080810 isoform B [Spinacia oleracea]|uniref:Uncharacterized protein isoform X2 n=1 Tax=Spinacia oleracea TaxID=3562 RepID=A0A9R0IM80_SPIOL|nr:uncharacterized protein LOC110791186 isoform X2 [Spinacia oleracea]KNA17348.1 hypothetical protein SOVF_080810 isoform B [Spinacia oleracea]